MFCDRCQLYIAHAVEHLHDFGHQLKDIGVAMTQPNPDQATVDSVTSALTTAFPLVQAQIGSTDFVPLNLADLVNAAQQYVDLAGPTAAA